MAQSDVKQVSSDGKVSGKRRFDQRDWNLIAENIIDDLATRERERSDLEKHWKDIDRQIAMQPENKYKKLADGKIDEKKRWMAELELPLQAQALEVLKSDSHRLRFPDTGLFFRAHAETTDEYLQTVDFQSLILGDQTDVPSVISQDDADKLVEGYLAHQFFQIDFPQRIDKIDAEALKYGMGIGRARLETKTIYMNESRGTLRETQRFPVLVPSSIKNTYLDTSKPSTHSAQILGPSDISVDYLKFENLMIAASKGSNDPNDPNGGWMPSALSKVVKDDRGYVRLIEMEGDIVVPRKTTRSFFIPGAIVTVAVGGKDGGGNATKGVVRFRFRKYPFSSYVYFPYQYESADNCYPTSPLMKGRPVQIAASDAINRTLDSAMLKIAPPVAYEMSAPAIEPYAQWQSADAQAIKIFTELGGDPAAMSSMLTNFLTLYAELTGVLPGRLGAQTVSHTTAYAKQAELQRGATRTVNYVNTTGQGAMVRWLDMAYRMGRDAIRAPISFRCYDGYVKVTKEQLPERAEFEWLGSGGPGDENQKMQARTNAIFAAAKLDQLNVQMGGQPRLNIGHAIDALLREGGWIDIDAITNQESGLAGGGSPATAVAALQNLGLQQPQ